MPLNKYREATILVPKSLVYLNLVWLQIYGVRSIRRVGNLYEHGQDEMNWNIKIQVIRLGCNKLKHL